MKDKIERIIYHYIHQGEYDDDLPIYGQEEAVKKLVKLFEKYHKGQFDLIKAIKWKQKTFNDTPVKRKNAFEWNEGMNFGFEQVLSLVYNWFNPDWYKEKDKKKKALK